MAFFLMPLLGKGRFLVIQSTTVQSFIIFFVNKSYSCSPQKQYKYSGFISGDKAASLITCSNNLPALITTAIIKRQNEKQYKQSIMFKTTILQ